MSVFLGISAASGLCIGKAFVVPDAQKRVIPQRVIAEEEHLPQWERFESALANISDKMCASLAEAKKNNDKIQSAIYETYFLMLSDPVFLEQLKKEFFAENLNIENVLNKRVEEDANKLRNSGNEYLAERAHDITDVFGKVLDEMLDFHPFSMEDVPDGSVVVATELSPADTMVLFRHGIAGLALTDGGVSSHVAILARDYGIPAVFDLEQITKRVTTGETLIVDGNAGEVISNPEEAELDSYRVKTADLQSHRAALRRFRDKPALSKDGVAFSICANIGTPQEAEIALKEGADGIGLFRTEFLFMSDSTGISASHAHAFSEEKQFSVYKQVLQTMGNKPVTVRTLDAGGDKIVSSAEIPVGKERNPLLGLRAIRLSLAYPQQLKTQLRALYRASVFGNLKIMLPLITSAEQIAQAKMLISAVQQELEHEGIPFSKNVPVGIMVETAAAAVLADELAAQCDFFSIGTNDLTQYTIGVDRENPSVAALYDETHPAVLRLIRHTVQAAAAHGIEVSVCGEMAARPQTVLVLAQLGLRNLSMSAVQICTIKALLAEQRVNSAKEGL